MPQDNSHSFSRRRFLKTTGAAAVAASGPAVIIPGRTQPKTLRMTRMVEGSPTYKPWFEGYANEWGERNNIRVIIDWVGWDEIDRLRQEEIAAQHGHDIFDCIDAPLDQVIDLTDVYEECERRYGKPIKLVNTYTYDPKAKKYWRFLSEVLPTCSVYRQDLWTGIGMAPNTWDDIRLGGRKLKFLHNQPVAIDAGLTYNGETFVFALLFAFGASVQDAENRPALYSRQTLEALKFGKALYEEAMPEESLNPQFGWSSLLMLAGEACMTLGNSFLTRTAETKRFPVSDELVLGNVPAGPAGRYAPPLGTRRYVIWKFAENIESAKQFFVDYISQAREAFLASQFLLFPTYPQVIPDLHEILSHDANVVPPNKYKALVTAGNWTTDWAYPGTNNPADSEISNAQLIMKMFANAASGKMTPKEALTQADQEVRKIYDKWRALGKV